MGAFVVIGEAVGSWVDVMASTPARCSIAANTTATATAAYPGTPLPPPRAAMVLALPLVRVLAPWF